MSLRVLVSFPDACEVSAAFAGQLNAILRDRALDSRLAPFGLAPRLRRFDGAVLGCCVDDGDALEQLAGFTGRRSVELEDLPAALFVLGADREHAVAGLDAIRTTLDPVSVGLFDASGAGAQEARRWAAQLAWTLVSAAHLLQDAPPLPYAVGR